MPLDFSFPVGKVTLPAGWIPGTLVESPIDGGTCGELGSTSVYLNRGTGTFEFKIPARFQQVHPERLRFSLWNDSGSGQAFPETAIFDWISQSWTTLTGIQSGINLIPQADQFINKDGEIRIRISAAESNPGCYFMALGLDGNNQ